MIDYPSMEEVNNASHGQLARWSRFLPSPGTTDIHLWPGEFELALTAEKLILDRILERFEMGGGWNPRLSKQVGWT